MQFLKRRPNLLLPLARFSTAATASKALNPILDFLTNTCGLSSHMAAATFNKLPFWASLEQAVSVRHFLKYHSFSDSQIPKLIRAYPRILSSDVDETLQPNFEILRGLGFSETELQLLILSHPSVLIKPLSAPNANFFKPSLFGFKKHKRTKGGISRGNDRGKSMLSVELVLDFGSKISELKKNRCSDQDVLDILKYACSFVALVPLRTGLLGLSRIELDDFDAKLGFFMGTVGWSEEQFVMALAKDSGFIHVAEDDLWEKVMLLAERGKCLQSYVVANPELLTMDLERLRPTVSVMEALKGRKLIPEELGLFSVVKMPEKKFVHKFVLRYNEAFPRLYDTYADACSQRVAI